VKRINMDTTVQGEAVRFPTDVRLHDSDVEVVCESFGGEGSGVATKLRPLVAQCFVAIQPSEENQGTVSIPC